MLEGLAMQLGPHNIGVSVLCPGYVRTANNCVLAGRKRPKAKAGDQTGHRGHIHDMTALAKSPDVR